MKFSPLAKMIYNRCFQLDCAGNPKRALRARSWAMLLAEWATTTKSENALLKEAYKRPYKYGSNRFYYLKKRLKKIDPALYQLLFTLRKSLTKKAVIVTTSDLDRLVPLTE